MSPSVSLSLSLCDRPCEGTSACRLNVGCYFLHGTVSALAKRVHSRGIPLHLRPHHLSLISPFFSSHTHTHFFPFVFHPTMFIMRNVLVTSFAVLLAALAASAMPINGLQSRGVVENIFDGIFYGKATFFHPKEEGGEIGACGPKEDDNSPIVALNMDQFGTSGGKSEWCNKKVLIRHKDKEVVATITDACPQCDPHSLDLTTAVFLALDMLKTGVIDITWCVLGTKNCQKRN
ncbi:hypothetical protein BX666DRAFT_1947482 [Dichotomocladium elegans]|nr:hypothetical protein BX666DRAFT_1947482 [Dichotomocladium elegans]